MDVNKTNGVIDSSVNELLQSHKKELTAVEQDSTKPTDQPIPKDGIIVAISQEVLEKSRGKNFEISVKIKDSDGFEAFGNKVKQLYDSVKGHFKSNSE